MSSGPGNVVTSQPLSRDHDDPLLSFPSESDATRVERPKDFGRESSEAGHEPFVPAARPEPESSKTEPAALAALHDLSRHIDERLAALQALAEAVTVNSQTLNGQKEMIEQAEVKLGRLEEVAAETAAQLERKERLKDELGRELVRLETEVQHLTESAQRQIEASKTDSRAWDDLRLQLRETERAIKQSVVEGSALKGVLEEIEQRLGPLAALQDLSRHTDERFEALHSLAEEVTVKGQTLSDQKEMIERAVAEAGRVAVLVDALETRLAKLKDGDHLLELTEARFGRLEEVAAETTAQFQRRDRLRDELGLELARQEMEVQVLTESGRRLQDVGRHTDEQFKALNKLAEEVTAKGDTLNGQKAMIERAVVEAGRVAGLVSAMETRMAALKDAEHRREQTEARLERLETVTADTAVQLQRSERLRDELRREVVRLETEVQILTESAQRQTGTPIHRDGAFAAVDSRPFTHPRPHLERPTPLESLDVRVAPPLLGMEPEKPSDSPDLPLADLVTRLRTRNTTDGSSVRRHDVGSVRLLPDRRRLTTYWAAGIGLAVLVLASVISNRPFGKPTQIDAKPQPAQTLLPAQTPPAFSIAVPALSGKSVTPNQLRKPAIATRPPTVATRPPAVATRPAAVDTRPATATTPAAEYFGVLEIESTPAGAVVFVDQRPVGETPLQLLRVRAGSHAVRIERDGYQRWTTAVNVPASQVTRVTAKLDTQAGR